MNSFEENIKKQQLLQKSFAETFTGQNEVFKIVEVLRKAGVPEDEMIEKAKYIRREGTKGNYKYIYEEPKDSGKFKQIKGDEVWGEKWRKKSKEEIQKEIEYIKKELKVNPNDIGKTNESFKRKLDYLNELIKQPENKNSTQNKEDQKAKIAKVMREFKEGKLKSSSGEVVKDKEQAIAIALSEAGLSKK